MLYIRHFLNLFSSVFFRFYHIFLLPLRYNIRTVGADKVFKEKTDPKGGILFLSNHPSHLDASFIGTTLIKQNIKISIWTLDYVFKNMYTRMVARNSDTTKLIKVPNVHESRNPKNLNKIRQLIRRTVEGLKEGENILFFPGGAQKFMAYEEINGKSAVERILRQYPDVNIVLVRITGMWGSRFSKAVTKSERSNLKGGGWIPFVWNIAKIMLGNLLFFIPKRQITLEFCPAKANFPRRASRKEINTFIEKFFNKSFDASGEPLQRVPDYFWKGKYVQNEYHIKGYKYDLSKVDDSTKTEVLNAVAKVAHVDKESLNPKTSLDRDLALDSLEIAEVLTLLEEKFKMPKKTPKDIHSIGHLMAITAGIPIEYVPISGKFPIIHQEIPFVAKAHQVCYSLLASLFGFLYTQR